MGKNYEIPKKEISEGLRNCLKFGKSVEIRWNFKMKMFECKNVYHGKPPFEKLFNFTLAPAKLYIFEKHFENYFGKF